MTQAVCSVVLFFAAAGVIFVVGSVEHEISRPEVMSWSVVELCEFDSDQCWANDGPHPVIGYDTNGLDPASMLVRLELDGKEMLVSEEPSQEVTVLMRSPHELPTRRTAHDSHFVRARIVRRDSTQVLAEHTSEFSFNLSSARQRAASPPAPCPTQFGGNTQFNYRGGDGHGMSHMLSFSVCTNSAVPPLLKRPALFPLQERTSQRCMLRLSHREVLSWSLEWATSALRCFTS
jgi:hypothetical protein